MRVGHAQKNHLHAPCSARAPAITGAIPEPNPYELSAHVHKFEQSKKCRNHSHGDQPIVDTSFSEGYKIRYYNLCQRGDSPSSDALNDLIMMSDMTLYEDGFSPPLPPMRKLRLVDAPHRTLPTAKKRI